MVNHMCIGMTLVAYDGSPFYPKRDSVFDLVEAYGVTSYSLSPRYLQILLLEGYKPKETHDLSRLNTIFSAGSPLKAELYAFIRDNIKDVFINNGTGGTDVCAAFIGANPWLPIYAGIIQCPLLGIALECFGDDGKPVKPGDEGDMVITKPFPNMPLGFIGDDNKKSRLRASYFDHYPNRCVWYQSDWSGCLEGCACVKLAESVLSCSDCRSRDRRHQRARKKRWRFESWRSALRQRRAIQRRRGDDECVSSTTIGHEYNLTRQALFAVSMIALQSAKRRQMATSECRCLPHPHTL